MLLTHEVIGFAAGLVDEVAASLAEGHTTLQAGRVVGSPEGRPHHHAGVVHPVELSVHRIIVASDPVHGDLVWKEKNGTLWRGPSLPRRCTVFTLGQSVYRVLSRAVAPTVNEDVAPHKLELVAVVQHRQVGPYSKALAEASRCRPEGTRR